MLAFKDPLCMASVVTVRAAGAEHVVEAAALRFEDGVRTATFSKLAGLPCPVPLVFTEMTGLDDSRLRGHPSGDLVVEELMEFVGGATLVVHDAGRLSAMLSRLAVQAPKTILDLQVLARTAMPTLDDYSLGGVAAALRIERRPKLRALNDALLCVDLWQALLSALAVLPRVCLGEIVRLLKGIRSPYLLVFNALVDAGSEAGFLGGGLDGDYREALGEHTKLLKEARSAERACRNDHISVTDVVEAFDASGALGRALEGYERRPEQQDMARHVSQAFNTARHLMVEAGTGTGKSMAYLVPALLWTRQNDDRVVISTNTKNLQSQLYEKDIPLLRRAFPKPFNAALVKGRGNYLCVRKLMQVLDDPEREFAAEEEYLALLPVIAWAAATRTGDGAECTGLQVSPLAPAIWDRLCSNSAECQGNQCALGSRCFFRKNRAEAFLADIIIANHSVVFANMGIENPSLPPYRCIVFDEAHNLEDAATDFFSREFDRGRVLRLTSRLYRIGRGRKAVGLLPRTLGAVEHELASNFLLVERLRTLDEGAMKQIDSLFIALDHLFDASDGAFADAEHAQDKRRFQDCPDLFDSHGVIGKAFAVFMAEVRQLEKSLRQLIELLEPAPEFPSRAALMRDLGAAAKDLAELADDVSFMAAHDDEKFVYWVQRLTRAGRYVNYAYTAAPVHVAPLIHQALFEPMRTVVMCSATLTVGDSFEFMAERIGASLVDSDRIRTVNVGTPFNYEEQCLLAIPTFLPDPGGKRTTEFDESLASFLIDLLGATQGRALVLFTAYSLLGHVYDAVKPRLEESGIPVLGQGKDGTREAVTNLFRTIRSSVLLGTQSFWEGVDISGDTLSCLVVTKLPFQVFTEPLIRARAEFLERSGRSSFTDYSLPTAVIKLRQGFGRLIRSKTDRGVVVVTDRRIVEKAYGRYFLSSLPVRHKRYDDRSTLLRDVARFLRKSTSA